MDIIIIENDSNKDEIPFECSNPLIVKTFKLPQDTPKGTDVNFIVNRDKDGIIHVEAECGVSHISFVAKEIAENSIIQQVKETIDKMIVTKK